MTTMKQATTILILFFTINFSAIALATTEDNQPDYQSISRYTRIAFDIHGPVIFGETLWQIAQGYYSNSDISINPAMVGLFRLNPGAFNRSNINCLKKGELLLLPATNTFSTLSDQEASHLVREHHQQWQLMQRRCDP